MSRSQLATILALFLTASPLVSSSKKTSPGGLTGVQEFFTSGTFTVPAGVTSVLVQMWGGGGGGGGAPACQVGGAGGGGGYTETVVAVTAGTTYTVTVGSGGLPATKAQEFSGENGGNGGDSQFTLSSTVLAFAGGGQGGGQNVFSNGAGGATDPSAEISHGGYERWTFNNAETPPALHFRYLRIKWRRALQLDHDSG